MWLKPVNQAIRNGYRLGQGGIKAGYSLAKDTRVAKAVASNKGKAIGAAIGVGVVGGSMRRSGRAADRPTGRPTGPYMY